MKKEKKLYVSYSKYNIPKGLTVNQVLEIYKKYKIIFFINEGCNDNIFVDASTKEGKEKLEEILNKTKNNENNKLN